jgi:septum site-determining protein MinC
MSRQPVSHLAVPTLAAGPDTDWEAVSKKSPEINQGVILDFRKATVEVAREALRHARGAGIRVIGAMGGDGNGLDVPHFPASPTRLPFQRARQGGDEAPVADTAATANPPRPRGREASLVVSDRVRSGQQVVATNRDLIVTQAVSQGAELISDGSVHIYGPMSGRVFAGHAGDTTARIYCLSFTADLVSIAGHYQVFETIHDSLAGQPVMIWLDNGQLMIQRLVD